MFIARLASVFVAGMIASLLLSGCGPVGQDGVTAGTPASPSRPSETPVASPVPPVAVPVPPVAAPVPAIGTAATATTPRTSVYVKPGGTIKLSLANPRPSGAPLTFLVVQSIDGWLEVNLPDRPNGSRGWIDASAVSLQSLEYDLMSPRNRTH